MNQFLRNFAVILFIFAGNTSAQSGLTRVYTIPDGVAYTVDGAFYRSMSSAVWPAGSKHILSVNPVQQALNIKTQYAFTGWNYAGGILPGGPTVTVSADPTLKEFWAVFSIQHAISLNYSDCSPDIPCPSPGTIYVNDVTYKGDADVYLNQGTVVKLLAVPADGFVFTGWEQGPNQVVTGFLNTVTVNSPTIVRPHFRLARHVNLQTVPAELEVFADGGRIPTPASVDWAYGSTHTVGVPSPQESKTGSWWVFSKWSDGGAANHAFAVGDGGGQVTLTATFVPATGTELRTSPQGLPLRIDGRDNWPSYYFTWAAGETHKIEAPAQQTDDKGRVWNFSSWSNGGARVQDYVAAPGPSGGTMQLIATYTPVGHLVVNSAVAALTVRVDGADCATPCDVLRPVGTVVHLSAPASVPTGDNTRLDFDGWPGSGSLSADWTVTLGADPVKPYLTYHPMNRLVVASDPADGASWRMQPASSDGFYDAQATVIVSVTALPGFRFRRWTGDVSGTSSVASVPMNTPRLVEAMLDRVPFISPAGVANAAGSTPEKAVAAGSIVSIFGASFAPDMIVGPDNPMAQALGCVTVRIGDRMLPLFFVSPSQINVQMPEDIGTGDQKLVVSCQGLPDVQAVFSVGRNAPGLFQDDKSAGVLEHEDGSAVTANSPAKTGELLTLYGTGFGPTDRGRPFGFAPSTRYPIVDSATVQAGDVAIPAENVFATAGRIGVDAVQFRLPEATPSGSLSLRVTINGKDSNTVVAPVQ